VRVETPCTSASWITAVSAFSAIRRGSRKPGKSLPLRSLGCAASCFSSPAAIDVGQSLDEGPFTAFQKMVVLLAALSIVMDGFDGQLIGFAIPVIIKEWGVTRGAFAPVVAAGLIGMAIGSASSALALSAIG
jgi:hypothetical protein